MQNQISPRALANTARSCSRTPLRTGDDSLSSLHEDVRALFRVKERLLDAGCVRSGNTLGDLGEWFVHKRYGLELCRSCRNPDFEGYIHHEGLSYRVQVKVHDSTEGTNLKVGNPGGYDALLVLVGPNSFLRDRRVSAGEKYSFHVYVLEPREIKEAAHAYSDGTYSFAKTVLHAEPPFDIIQF